MTPVCPVCHKQISGSYGLSPYRICYRCGAMFIAQDDLDKVIQRGKIMIDPDTKRGLYNKFNIKRLDGSSETGGKHEKCAHFVLDLEHDKFSKPALEAYAAACESEYPELAKDLRQLCEITP